MWWLYPAGVVTEALAWLNTLVIAGMSVGSFAGGIINDGSGPRAAFAVVALIAAAPLVLVLAFRPAFTRLPAACGGEPAADV